MSEYIQKVVLETNDYRLRVPILKDAEMMMQLVNQQDFIYFIGDKNVSKLEDAEKLIENSFISHHKQNGFCLYVVEQKTDNTKVGICGLVNREGLDSVDIGYAILSEFQGMGIASETTKAVLDYTRDTLKLKKLAGITSIDNDVSSYILEKIGLKYIDLITLGKENKKTKLYEITF